jgi:hypothetical protein
MLASGSQERLRSETEAGVMAHLSTARVAMISGANRGIGLAIAERLAQVAGLSVLGSETRLM